MDMWIFFSEKSDRATVRLAEGLPAWLKALSAHSTQTVLAYEWYCIVRTLPIPAPLNGFNHWFRFSYTVLLENDSLPLLWTPWFPQLTCLEDAVEMSCCPSHGQDPTPTLKDKKKKKIWIELKLRPVWSEKQGYSKYFTYSFKQNTRNKMFNKIFTQ